MSTADRRTPGPPPTSVPPLENGDRLTQPEFHRRYEECPDGVKFELIGGIVYMASPLRLPHAIYHEEFSFALGHYRRGTPGLQLLPDATAILGEESEPQPDLSLRILPEFGGQSRSNKDQYMVGPPEWLAEIAHSTRAIDMHLKKNDYHSAGVVEYVVLCVEEQELHWFDFKKSRPLSPNPQGIYRSRVFPGLWIDGPALLALDSPQVIRVVQQGLASREHAAFVKRLQAFKARHSKG